MASITTQRDTPQMGGTPLPALIPFPVAANTRIYKGVMVGIDSSGNLVDGAAAAAVFIVGKAAQDIDNTTGNQSGFSGLAGGATCNVAQGVFQWNNSASTDLIANANVGQPCYVADNQTVALTGAGVRLFAGIITNVDTNGVWVENTLLCGGNPQQSGYPQLVIPVALDLTALSNATIWTYTPKFALRVLKLSLSVTKAATGAGATSTLTPQIGGVAITGGVVTPTLATATLGAEIAGTAVTAANICAAGTALTIVSSANTSFTAGNATLYVHCG